MSSNVFAQMGVIATEVKKRQTKNGTTITEFPVYFNDYVPTVGQTSLEAVVTVWGERAEKLYEAAQKHTRKKDGNEFNTNGKGMPLFFIGYLYTNKYTNKENIDVRQTKLHCIDWSYSEVPVFSAKGTIGTEVSVRSVQLKAGGKATVAQLPVFFNGYVPGVGKTAKESFVTLWRDKAEWLFEQAQKHSKKDGTETNGKGMMMEFVCYEHTEEYQKDGEKRKTTKLIVADIKYANNVFSNSQAQDSTSKNTSSKNSYNKTNEENKNTNKSEQKQEESKENDTKINFELEGNADSNDLLGDFDKFLEEMEEEQTG